MVRVREERLPALFLEIVTTNLAPHPPHAMVGLDGFIWGGKGEVY